MVQAFTVVAVGLAIGLVPTRWLRIPEPMVLLVAGALMRVAMGGDANSDVLNVAAFIGLFTLLFGVGVELSDLGHRPLTPRGALLAVIGAVVLCGLGVALVALVEPMGLAVLAIALSSIPTSAGIAARLIRPHGTGKGSGYPTIISAAVADDFFGIALLVLAPLLATGAALDLVGAPTIALLGSVLIVAGMLLIRPSGIRAKLVKVGILSAIGIASGASAALLGVFDGHEVAPMMTGTVKRAFILGEKLLPTMFFMAAGYAIRLPLLDQTRVLTATAAILIALLVSRIVIATAAPGPLRARLAVGAGMLARGEVTIAMALVFLQSRVISNADYATLMAIVLVSTTLSAITIRLNQLGR